MADDPKKPIWDSDDEERPTRPPARRPIPLPPSSPAAEAPQAVPPPLLRPVPPIRLPVPDQSDPATGPTTAREELPKRALPDAPPVPHAETSLPPLRSPSVGFGEVASTAASATSAAAGHEREAIDSSASPPQEDPYSTEFFDRDEEPFDQPGVEKLGIVGGKGVGKSYLFQSMVYRTYAGSQSGALTYYLEGIRLFRALKRSDRAQTMNLARFVKKYASWERLPQTQLDSQQWYRLRLRYRTGILGQERSALDVEFFDGSGEGFFEAARNFSNRNLWKEGYLNARVMVFCLPLWAAFPGPGFKREDWDQQDQLLEGFEQVVQNYTDMRTLNKQTKPVCSILALTQADDRRSALKTLHDRWIQPYMDSPHTYLRQLRRGAGVAQYLANARKVSEALHEEFAAARDPRVASIPRSLEFGRGRPWLIPLSAIEGGQLDELEGNPRSDGDRRRDAPVPVHVELPLLVALCERDNALM